MKHVFYLFAIALLAITLSTSTPAKAYAYDSKSSQSAADCNNTGTALPINSGVAYLIIVGAVTGAVFLRRAVLGSEAEAKANY